MILAGDIGGTKCNLALFAESGEKLSLTFQARIPTRDSASFIEVLEKFLQLANPMAHSNPPTASTPPVSAQRARFSMAIFTL